MILKILFFGDIVGEIGREAIKKVILGYKKKYNPDFIMANVENLAHGKGATQKTLQEMLEAGINFFTSGNHIWSKKEIFKVFEEKKIPLIRPANYPPIVPGEGYKVVEIGTKKLLVVNLLGRVFIQEDTDCPFRKIDEILKKFSKEKLAGIIIDFHAEVTSETVALGFYLDGRVSAFLGTHTHIPTADNKILPQGTAYLTDVGMVGAKDSVLGVDKKNIIKTFLTQIRFEHEIPKEGICTVNAVLIEIETKTKKAISIKRIDQEVLV